MPILALVGLIAEAAKPPEPPSEEFDPTALFNGNNGKGNSDEGTFGISE